MATLITGAGLVGSTAAAQLLELGEDKPVLYDVAFAHGDLADRFSADRVVLVRGDINDVPDLVRALQQFQIERVIHTAGFLTPAVRERPYAGTRVNLFGTAAVLEAARLAGVKRVVLCSSSTVYLGVRKPPPSNLLGEDFALRTESEYPPAVYASMKLAAEWLGHCYRNEYDLDFAVVRFGAVFGPWRGAPSGWLSLLLKRLIESALGGPPCSLSTEDLRRACDYVYAADAAQGAVKAAMATAGNNHVYNISMGVLSSGQEIVDTIERVSGRKVSLDIRPGGTGSNYLDEVCPMDVSRAQQELGYRVMFPMEGAIRDYIGWLDRYQNG